MLLKKSLPLLLCTAFMLCLGVLALPRAAYAAPATSVNIWGVELNTAYPYYVNGANGVQGTRSDIEPATNWNAHFDATNGTLTLEGLDVRDSTALAPIGGDIGCGVYVSGDITLNLIGYSVISAADSSTTSRSWALFCYGSLTAAGDGRLVASGRNLSAGADSIGVYVYGPLTLPAGFGGTLEGQGGVAEVSVGVQAGVADMAATTVSGGSLRGLASDLNAPGSETRGLGLFSLTMNGGSVEGEAGTCSSLSIGVSISNTMQLSGGSFVATGKAAAESYGLLGTAPGYSGGTLICRASAPGWASKSAPGIAGGTAYHWRTFDGNPYISSTTNDFPSEGHKNPYIELTTNATLSFTDDPAFDVPAGTVGTDIAAIDVSTGVAGGFTPYTFALESAPSWLAADSGTGVITGTRPTTAQAATTATVRVTDSTNPQETATITVDIGAVEPALSAPVITDPVADKTVTVVSGSKAILSVAATSAVPPVYTWQVNTGNGWSDIPDATGASYTTAAVTLANSGYCYRCVVSNSAGTVTSPVFTVNIAATPSFAKTSLPSTGDSAWPVAILGILLVAGTGLVTSGAAQRSKRQAR